MHQYRVRRVEVVTDSSVTASIDAAVVCIGMIFVCGPSKVKQLQRLPVHIYLNSDSGAS